MDEVIAQHSKQLVQFRERLLDLQLEPYRNSDAYLVNWLIYTGFDLKKSEALLRTSVKWREQHNMDRILEEGFLDLTPLLPFKHLGYDKGGRPVLEIRLGSWKVRDAAELNRDQALRYLFRLCETLDNACKLIFSNAAAKDHLGSHPGNVNQFTAILDCKDISFQQFGSPKSMKIIIAMIQAAEANYPNMPYKLLLLNVHKVVRILVKLISPFLSAYTYSTIKMLGYNTEEWKEELLNLVEADVLPVRYGGNNVSNEQNSELD